MTKAKKGFIVTFIVIVIWLLLEVICQNLLLTWYNRNFDASLISPKKYGLTDGMKPNVETICWNQQFTTNEFGFRSTKRFNERKKTWLFIGDSVTQGFGVDDASNFVSLLANDIDSLNVLNCSLIGWSISDYKRVLAYLTYEEKEFSIDYLTIGWCLNDIYTDTPNSNLPKMGKGGWQRKFVDFLQNNSAVFRFCKLWLTKNTDYYFQYDKQFYLSDWRVTQVQNEIDDIIEICANNNIDLSFVIFPYKSELINNTVSPASTIFSNYNTKAHYGTPNLHDSKVPINSLYLFSDEIHFSKLGHQLISKDLLKHIYGS